MNTETPKMEGDSDERVNQLILRSDLNVETLSILHSSPKCSCNQSGYLGLPCSRCANHLRGTELSRSNDFTDYFGSQKVVLVEHRWTKNEGHSRPYRSDLKL